MPIAIMQAIIQIWHLKRCRISRTLFLRCSSLYDDHATCAELCQGVTRGQMSAAASDPYVDDTTPLYPDNAAGAIITGADGRYILQLRDSKPGIFFPGHWGCFGGAVEDDDADPSAGLRRELREELGLDLPEGSLEYFTNYTFDLAFCGGGVIYRTFYEARLDEGQVAGLHLGEGCALRLFSAREVLSGLRLTPYDAFGLWMHINRHRLGRAES